MSISLCFRCGPEIAVLITMSVNTASHQVVSSFNRPPLLKRIRPQPPRKAEEEKEREGTKGKKGRSKGYLTACSEETIRNSREGCDERAGEATERARRMKAGFCEDVAAAGHFFFRHFCHHNHSRRPLLRLLIMAGRDYYRNSQMHSLI